jgi:hypothetical protein
MQSISLDFVSRKFNNPIDVNQTINKSVTMMIPILTWSIRNRMISHIREMNNVESTADNKLITMSALYCLYCGEKSTYKSNWYRVFVNKCDYYLGGFWWGGLRKVARRIPYYNKGE